MKTKDNWKSIFGTAPNVSPKATLKSDYWRFRLLWLATVLVFVSLLARAFWLQVIASDELLAKMKVEKNVLIPAARGIIADRNNVPLAVSTPVMSLYLDVAEYLKVNQEKESILNQLKEQPNHKKLKRQLPKTNFDIDALALAVGLDADYLKERIVKRPKERHFVLRKQLPPDVAKVIMGRNFQSVYAETDFVRFYPQAQPNAQIIGIMGEEKPTLYLDVAEYIAKLNKRNALIAQIKADPQNLALAKDFPNTNFDLNQLATAVGMNTNDLLLHFKTNPDERHLIVARHVSRDLADQILKKRFQSVYQDDIRSVGVEGVERQWQADLAGTDGIMRVLRDRRGNTIKELGQVKVDVQGQDKTLSIDSRLQYIMYQQILSTFVSTKARSVSAMAVDVQTGEVLAMCSYPSYNPNDPNRSSNFDAMRNRPVLDTFEPGSTVKPFTVAAALETGLFTPRSTIDTNPGVWVVGGYSIKDHSNHGVMPLEDIIVFSSNVGASKLALKIADRAAVPMFLSRMGLGRKTALNFPGEVKGRLPTKGPWTDRQIASISYGYGVSVSLAQLVQAYSILGAGGVYHPLTLNRLDTAEKGDRILSAEIAKEVVHMMEGVVSSRGTAIKASVPGYTVAGKTGTAHKIRADGKGYDAHEYRALFMGLAPASNPRIALGIVVENPQGSYYGGEVAAPAFSKIMQESLRIMNVPLDKPFSDTPVDLAPKITQEVH